MRLFPNPTISLSLLACAASAVAQERRQALPDPGTPAPQAAVRSTPPVFGDPSTPQHDPLDDEPSFGPPQWVTAPDVQGGKRVRLPARNPYVLSFVSGDYTPEPGVDPRLLALQQRAPTATAYGYIMIQGRFADPDKMARLRAMGVTLIGPHTYQSWAASFPLDKLQQLASLPFVRWVGQAQPEQKLEPRLAELMKTTAPTDLMRISVSTFASDRCAATQRVSVRPPELRADERLQIGALDLEVPNGPFQKALEAAGFRFEHYTEIDNVFVFKGLATRATVDKIRGLQFVSFVEAAHVHRPFHDQAMSMTNQDKLRATYGGGKITVGVIDTGVQFRSNWHVDLVKQNVGWGADGKLDPFLDGHGHGTHVTGTIGGEGKGEASHTGAAPTIAKTLDSRLFIGRYFDDLGNPQGNPANLYAAMSNDYTYGSYTSPKPRVINNSWGANPPAGGWVGSDNESRAVDGYVYTHRQSYVFAAGNTGRSTTAYGTGAPGCAKNALTVGSVDDFAAGSIKAGDTSDFSSHSTKDGRRKPEILAPGQYVTSCSNRSSTGYRIDVGTSMAAPQVTGIVASFVEHYQPYTDYRPFVIKASLLATAEYQGDPGTSTGWFSTRDGYGLVNADQLHGTDPKVTWVMVSDAGSIQSSGGWQYWEGTIPADIKHAKVVLAWDEAASGGGASQARINDLRLHVDVEPFTSGGNTGEFAAYDSVSNVQSLAGKPFAASLAGKRVRFKVYGHSIASAVRWGMLIFMHKTDPNTAGALLTSTVSDSYVRTGGSLTMTGEVRSSSAGDQFDNLHLYPSLPSGWAATKMERQMGDGVWNTYTGSSHTSYPYPSLLGGMTLGSGNYRWLRWHLQAPTTQGWHQLWIYGNADPGNIFYSRAANVCVDSQSPPVIGGLASPTHSPNAWSNRSAFQVTWNAATDNGCAGIDQLFTVGSVGGPATPTNPLSATAQSQTLTLSSSTSPQYFNIQSRDRAGNLSNATNFGPVYIDLTAPVMSTVAINGGAAYTNNPNATVTASATDTYSGPSTMLVSPGSASWQPYTQSPVSVTLPAGDGVKTVTVAVRDKAGNQSSNASDTITFDGTPPDVGSVAIQGGARVTNVPNVTVVVSASDALSGMDAMRFSVNGGVSWTVDWTAYSTRPVAVVLPGGDGNKVVTVDVRDRAGNVRRGSAQIELDTTAPVITSVAVNGGAAYTNSPVVGVVVSASGNPTEMRYSLDNATWSPRMGYTAASRSIDTRLYGGNSSFGRKDIFVEIFDAANNAGRVVSGSIVFLPTPAIATVAPSQVFVVNHTRVRITGSGFSNVVRVAFGTRSITSNVPYVSWSDGWYGVVSDTELDIYTPQGLAPGSYTVSVSNAGFTSNTSTVSVVHNSTRTLGVAEQLPSNANFDILSHRGTMPPASLSVLTVSLSPRSVVIPGFVSLGHGGDGAGGFDPTFFLVDARIPHDPVTGVARWTFPAVITGTIYLQALVLEAARPDLIPLRTTNLEVLRIH
ncbi:MAG: S8 family serine peptidase [Planctomycetes bacterium]|nr:S8 family serine peptidase [Planctomycetota bacterium]